jgi:GPH family glycoside/pentoside/hexuronide:cation symporter
MAKSSTTAPSVLPLSAQAPPANSDSGAPLPVSEKIGYALGDAASNLFFQFFGIFLVFYYTDTLGLSAAAVGTMMLVTRIADAVLDPMVGAMADRTRTRWGRFRPYLLWLAIPYGVTGVLMFMCPDWDSRRKLLFAYITYTLMMFIYSAINVPYSALMGVMSSSSAERTRLSSYRFVAAFGAGSLISYLALPMKNWLGQGNDKVGFLWTMGIFSVLSVICFCITFATTKERVQPMADEKVPMHKDAALLVRTLPWVMLFLASVCNLVAYCVRAGAQMYYFKYVVGSEKLASWFMVSSTLAAMAGIAFSPWITARVGKRAAMMGLFGASAACYASFFILPANHFGLLISVNILGALAFGPAGSIIWAMYADTADYIEWKHGRRITGLVYAGVLFAIKMGIALGGALLGWVLAGYGFKPNTVPSPETITGIKLVFSLLPAGLFVTIILLLCGYSLNERKVAEIEAALRGRRNQAAGLP